MPEMHVCTTERRRVGCGRDAGGYYVVYALYCSICGARMSAEMKVYGEME